MVAAKLNAGMVSRVISLCPLQCSYFCFCQCSPFTGWQFAEFDAANLHPDQPDDFQILCLKHATNFAILPLSQLKLYETSGAVGADQCGFGGPQRFAAVHHAP